MAENIITLESLDLLFADFVQDSLGMSGDKVLISYSEKGQKSSKIDEDVCYVKTDEVRDQINIHKQRVKAYDKATNSYIVKQTAMRVICLHLVFYGPNSSYLATKINEIMYTTKANEFIYNNNLALIPDKTDFVVTTNEIINSRFWKRSDLRLYFYNSVIIEESNEVIEGLDVKIIIE